MEVLKEKVIILVNVSLFFLLDLIKVLEDNDDFNCIVDLIVVVLYLKRD